MRKEVSGLYNMLFGQNPMSQVLLAVLGLTESDVGRFRNVFVSDGTIAVYTRNGGGNRKHYKWDAHDRWNNETRQMDKRCHWNYETKAWEDIADDCDCDHGPCFEEGLECYCTGCTISYHLPAHPLYIRDEDDDSDRTYATIYFNIPEQFKEDLKKFELAEPFDPSKEWQEMLSQLKQVTP